MQVFIYLRETLLNRVDKYLCDIRMINLIDI